MVPCKEIFIQLFRIVSRSKPNWVFVNCSSLLENAFAILQNRVRSMWLNFRKLFFPFRKYSCYFSESSVSTVKVTFRKLSFPVRKCPYNFSETCVSTKSKWLFVNYSSLSGNILAIFHYRLQVRNRIEFSYAILSLSRNVPAMYACIWCKKRLMSPIREVNESSVFNFYYCIMLFPISISVSM